MLYVLSYPVLAGADAERIEAFRRIHEPERAGIVRGHITLVFGVRSIAVEDLRSRVAALAATTAPFGVTFDVAEETRSDEGVHHVFLIAREGASTLESMHRQLHARSLGSELLVDRPFRAHMTVATTTSAELIDLAMRDIPKIGLPIRGVINALDIVAAKNGSIEDLDRLRLSGGPQEA